MNALEIYERARQIDDATARRHYLDKACQGDAALRGRVESMLGVDSVPESFLGRPLVDSSNVAADAPGGLEPGADPLLGSVIGGVRIERLVGQGGMGKVYVGTQTSTGGKVALKVLMPHAVSEGMFRRFDLEARLLARLRHPGIAQVYSVGTVDWGGLTLPYFVMELIVEARPITHYADEHRLDTKQRLELFQKVCAAVAYGHEHGVIHRDLKPANILVDRFGQPKVIDFGVAKCIDSDVEPTAEVSPAMLTTEGVIVGTLKYMSPEQAAGDQDAITVRSDVHALGVILYELLTREMPFDFHDALPIGVARIIQTQDPKPLSSVSRAFRGDLDAITAKCLEKDRNHRYATAAEIAAEISRHLAGEPILTRPVGFVGGLVRLFQKHKAAAAAVAGIAASFGAAVVGISMFAIRAEQARKQVEAAREVAVRSRAAAEELVQFMTTDLREKLTPIGRLDLMKDVFEKLKKYHDEYGRVEALGGERATATQLHTRARFHHGLGSLSAALDDLDAAETHAATALEILEHLVGLDPANEEWRWSLAKVHCQAGDQARTRGSRTAASGHYEKCLNIMESLVATNPTNGPWQRDQAAAFQRLGIVREDQGDSVAAIGHFASARAIFESLLNGDSENTEWSYGLASCHERLGTLAMKTVNRAEAKVQFEAFRAIVESLVAKDPRNTTWQSGLAQSCTRLGLLAFAGGDLEVTRREFERNVRILQKLSEWDPLNVLWQRELATGKLLLATTLESLNHHAAALDLRREAHALLEGLVAATPDNSQWQIDLSDSHRDLGHIAREAGDAIVARGHFERAVAIMERLRSLDTKRKDWQSQLARCHDELGRMAASREDHDQAMKHLEIAAEIWQSVCDQDPQDMYSHLSLAMSHGDRGDLARQRDDLRAAKSHYEKSLVLRKAVADRDPGNSEFAQDLSLSYQGLGSVARAQGDVAEARRNYEKRLEIVEDLVAREPSMTPFRSALALSHENIGRLAGDVGNVEESRRHHREAVRIQMEIVEEAAENDMTRPRVPTQRPATEAARDPAAAAHVIGGEQAQGPAEQPVVTNSLGMTFVWIPAGDFLMGTTETHDDLKKSFAAAGIHWSDQLESRSERPSHEVRITGGFLMGRHEVTVGQFRAFYDDGPKGRLSFERDGKGGWGYDPAVMDRGPFAKKTEYSPWEWGHPRQTDDHPVVNVSWNDCQAFCDWLSRKEHVKYRLPTEAEWEYACRAGSRRRYSNGDDPERLVTIGNTWDSSAIDVLGRHGSWDFHLRSRDGHVFTSPVGRYAPNPFGLHDMHGNVSEWCADWFDEGYYATSPAVDPKGPESGSLRAVRGGSWKGDAAFVNRSAWRWGWGVDKRDHMVGFRVVRESE